MYIGESNINIVFFVVVGLLGLLVGRITDWAIICLPDEKRVFSKDFFKKYLKIKKSNYILDFLIAGIYILLLFLKSYNDSILSTIDLVKYMVLTPMLIAVFVIDFKKQIIPNRLNLTIFEAGLIFALATSLYQVNLGIDMLIGGLIGAGIFLVITLIGGLIAGKNAIGFGDVKLMAGLGIFFGQEYRIVMVALIAFILGAITSVFLLVTKKKKKDEYIAFGPFIVIASFIVMTVPFETLTYCLFKVFTLGMYNG